MYGLTVRNYDMAIRESVVIMQFIYMLKLISRLVNNERHRKVKILLVL